MNIPSVCSWELSSALGERAGLSGDAFLASRWSHWSIFEHEIGKDLESRISLTLNSYQYVMTSICHISSLNNIECLYLYIISYIYIKSIVSVAAWDEFGMNSDLASSDLTRWASRVGSVLFGTRTSCRSRVKKGHRNPWTSPLDKIRGEFWGTQPQAVSVTCITFDSHLFWCVPLQTWKCSVASIASLALVADKQKSETNDCNKTKYCRLFQ